MNFAQDYGVQVWEDVFNFRLLPALDKESNRWLLVQKCSQGVIESQKRGVVIASGGEKL